jgi:hypothetical protein
VAVTLVLAVSIFSLLITLGLSFLDSTVLILEEDRSIKKIAVLWSWFFFKEVIKLNLSTFLLQIAILITLNIVTNRQSAVDLAQLAFSTQIFNQFGFFGVVLYPLFLRRRALGSISDREIMLQWTIGISVLVSAAVLLAFLVIGVISLNCGDAACNRFSGASPLSVATGLIIGALIVIRSPVAWIIQLTNRADVDVISHSVAGILITCSVMISSSVEVVLWSRAIASTVLVVLPIFWLLRTEATD